MNERFCGRLAVLDGYCDVFAFAVIDDSEFPTDEKWFEPSVVGSSSGRVRKNRAACAMSRVDRGEIAVCTAISSLNRRIMSSTRVSSGHSRCMWPLTPQWRQFTVSLRFAGCFVLLQIVQRSIFEALNFSLSDIIFFWFLVVLPFLIWRSIAVDGRTFCKDSHFQRIAICLHFRRFQWKFTFREFSGWLVLIWFPSLV